MTIISSLSNSDNANILGQVVSSSFSKFLEVSFICLKLCNSFSCFKSKTVPLLFSAQEISLASKNVVP